MTPDRVRKAIEEVLGGLAPEADLDDLSPGEDMRRALDLDSYDFLNLLVGLADQLGVEVPEADYARVQTLGDMIDYYASRAAPAKAP